jgi:hypothetical protein
MNGRLQAPAALPPVKDHPLGGITWNQKLKQSAPIGDAGARSALQNIKYLKITFYIANHCVWAGIYSCFGCAFE